MGMDYDDCCYDEIDLDQMRNRSEGSFESRADIAEGISGRAPADTSYENYSETIVQNPKSDSVGNDSVVTHPAPRPVDLYKYSWRRF